MADSPRPPQENARGAAVAVIPARYGSHRLPGKPLLRETGKFLIQHVVEKARMARSLSRIIVATDDPRIADAVRSFGGEAVLTPAELASGTDRVAAVARSLDAERIVNIQGDEPDIEPAHVDLLAGLLDDAEMGTLAAPFRDPAESALPQRVKVVLGHDGFARSFTRASVNGASLLHLGVYAYRRDCLLRLASLPPTGSERRERLEQLRALDHAIRIKVAVIPSAWPGGVDTREDYEAFVRRTRAP